MTELQGWLLIGAVWIVGSAIPFNNNQKGLALLWALAGLFFVVVGTVSL